MNKLKNLKRLNNLTKFEFLKEAKQLYRIVAKLRPRYLRAPKPTVKRLRLTYNNKRQSIRSKLVYLYGDEKANLTFEKIERKIRAFRKKKPKKLKNSDAHFNPLDRFTQKDIFFITYPDSLYEKNKEPLKTLTRFSKSKLKEAINTIHILPFYPSSSDRGFSPINYKKVDNKFGSWDDIKGLSEDFNLMFDGVFNHISSKSLWFRKYLQNNQLYENHFISFDSRSDISKEDLNKIVRPRTNELLTEFKSKKKKYVWTTFSKDQVDINYKEPKVLLRMIDVIIRYICRGATIIRLDAIGYSWKEPGTSCLNLKQAHVIVQLFRDVLDIIAPSVSLVTETNVPHAQNLRYLGNGQNEAQMVYNFTLPPLVLYTFYSGNAKYISRWADRLEKVSKYSTYFNFLASHDGIGLQPLKRVLPQKEVKFMIKEAKKHGSFVSYKNYGDKKKQPYELNITWWSAINCEEDNLDEETEIEKYLASHAIQLSLKGIPGIYVHSLFGTKNDLKIVEKSKHFRDINRKNLNIHHLKKELSKETKTKKVFEKIIELVKVRNNQKAFHPNAEQRILFQNDGVFSLIRTSADKTEKVVVLINVTNEEQEYTINCNKLKLNNLQLYDLLRKKRLIGYDKNIKVNEFTIALKPYETRWIKSTD